MDTSDVRLSSSLEKLMEELARNTHEIWARQRLLEGWTYGPRRDDESKTNPCLVDYTDLPESEKQYDRYTASETLKFIIKLGYRIQEPMKRFGQIEGGELPALMDRLKEPGALSTEEMIAIWLGHDPVRWAKRPQLYLLMGQRILRKGEPLLAYDILSEGLEAFPDVVYIRQLGKTLRPLYVRIRQQRALALAQSGATVQANTHLLDLYRQGLRDGETLGILGRTYKDLAMESHGPTARRTSLRSAYGLYREAFENALRRRKTDEAYYNGINAAFIDLLCGRAQKSRQLARRVKDICLRKLRRDSRKGYPDSYWVFATLGEAELLLDDLGKSEHWYQKAGAAGKGNFRDLASTRKQAHRILEEKGQNPSLMDHCFDVPSVVLFVGHMIDQPDRTRRRFPPELELPIRREIGQFLDQVNGGIAYGSAACGSDIIFLEEMNLRGGEIHIVLPFEPEHFRRESVDIIPGSDWGARFDRLLSGAAHVKVLGQYDPLNRVHHLEFSNLFLYGTALARADTMGTDLKPLAVWDGRPGDGPGGTASMIHHWQKQAQPFGWIDPLALGTEKTQADLPPDTAKGKKSVRKRSRGSGAYHAFLPFLFADVKGYSKLTEEQLVSFSMHYLKRVGDMAKRYDEGILIKRTQGDGLFVVFKDLVTAARLAVDLRNRIARVHWHRYGLPANLSARISLDAGPCYSFRDQVTGYPEFCGSYVNRAARIEPITPPGQIYASESFVALSKAMGFHQIRFEYVGQVVLPKGFGTIPAYHLRSCR
jgi:class 3 adenylate cyclase